MSEYNKSTNDESDKSNFLSSSLRDSIKQLLAILVPALAAAVISAVTSIGTYIRGFFYSEVPIITSATTNADNLYVNDAFGINLYISPAPPLNLLSGGIIKISYDPKRVKPDIESQNLLETQVGQIKSVSRLFGKSLGFIALSPGDTKIQITYCRLDVKLPCEPESTGKGIFHDFTKIKILKDSQRNHLSPHWDANHKTWNFSGKWNFDIENIFNSQMTIVDTGQYITGTYTGNGIEGTVLGHHDSDNISLTLEDSLQNTKRYYHLNGIFKPGVESNLKIIQDPTRQSRFIIIVPNEGGERVNREITFSMDPFFSS